MIELSVIVCTHNPDLPMLAQVIEALRGQTLETQRWELVLIDNFSETRLDPGHVNWHPQGRLVREEKLGLTPARLRGIIETSGDLLVFVDDDAILAPDYVRQALDISRARPQIGVFGGNVVLKPEIDIPKYFRPHLALLAERKVDKDVWGFGYSNSIAPCGVGMAVQRKVALTYQEKITPIGRALDRKGADLASGGDNDIAFTACDMGLAIGLFASLTLTHHIPKHRLTRSYMLKLIEGVSFSSAVLAGVRSELPQVRSVKHRCKKLFEYTVQGKLSVGVMLAKYRGQRRAKAYLHSLN